MDKSFKSIVKLYKPIAQLNHKQTVVRLYRQSLRTCNSWAECRDVFNEEATKIRAQFDNCKHLPQDSPEVQDAIKYGKSQLDFHDHPDPYINAAMPGGSLFMRNAPFPLEALYPDGIPEGISRRRLNIDFSNIPDDQPWADKCFVDSANKKYWIDR